MRDDVLLSEAYDRIYNEGIVDRLKGQASGIGAGLKQGAQNLAGKVASKLGADVKTSGDTAGGAYSNAQQQSLVNSFIQKAQKEINDFNNDVSKMGVNPDEEQFPEIKSKLDSVNKLISFLKNPQGAEPTPAAPSQGESQPTNFNADLVDKTPVKVQHGLQNHPKPFAQSAQSFTSSPTPPIKNVTPPEEQEEPTGQDEEPQDAEVSQPSTADYVNSPEFQGALGKPKEKSTAPESGSVQATGAAVNGGNGDDIPKTYTKKNGQWFFGKKLLGNQDKIKRLDGLLVKQGNQKPQGKTPQQGGGLKSAADVANSRYR